MAAIVVALFVLMLPSLASANWTHKGKGELTEDAAVTLSGQLTLSTSAGNVSCPTTIGATLTKSSSAGDVNSYTVSEPSKCDLTGSLGAICGTNGLTKVEKTGTWALTAEESDIVMSSIDLHFNFNGCFIPKFRLKGTATVSVNKESAISNVTLSGTQTLYNALGEEAGTGNLGGTLSVSPAATYGIKPPPTVETKWLMSNEHLSEDGELGLNGNFSFSGSMGSVTCPVSAELGLTAATVEEEDPEGEVEAFAVAKPSECDVGGTLKTACGTNSVSSVEKTGTWSLTATEEDISVSKVVLDYKFKECIVSSLRVEGIATLSVKSPTSIEEVTYGGELSVYNAAEEKIGMATASGTQSASPAGTFAIAEGVGGGGSPGPPLELSGPAKYETLGTGIECTWHMSIDVNEDVVEPTTDLTSLELTTNTCEFFGFLYAECELEEPEADQVTGLPWGIDVTGADKLTLTDSTAGGPGLIDFQLQNKPSEECFTTQNDLTIEDITMDVSTVGGRIHDVSLSGEMVLDNALGENPVDVAGTLTVVEADTGTYELESP